jgi:cytochrome c peroxidase
VFRKQIYFTFLLIASLLFVLVFSSTSVKKKQTKETLGEKLFFDKLLSLDKSVSCASCHKPEFAFADTVAFSKGVNGVLGLRNAPSVMNMASRDALFYDGRANDLVAQVVFPIEDKHEMNIKFGDVVKRIQTSRKYQLLFKDVFKKMPDSTSIIQAIAAYERTLETEDTPNDRWLSDEKNHGMTESQLRGRELFIGTKAKCFDCHFTPDFTSDEFKNIGLFDGKTLNDSGRYYVTKNKEDIGKFKIPGLRNVAITAPYMHNGMFKTLRQVIDYYDNPNTFVTTSINRDTLISSNIGLTEMEKNDLENFLKALTDDRFK